MISRAQHTPFGEWWWTVDRLTLAAIGALMLAGVVLSLAASPPVAARLGLDPFFFVKRHILYVLPAIAVMLGVSFLSPRQIRHLSLVVFVASLIMVAATPYFGPRSRERGAGLCWSASTSNRLSSSNPLLSSLSHGCSVNRQSAQTCPQTH